MIHNINLGKEGVMAIGNKQEESIKDAHDQHFVSPPDQEIVLDYIIVNVHSIDDLALEKLKNFLTENNYSWEGKEYE
jgi:hypothetical protein